MNYKFFLFWSLFRSVLSNLELPNHVCYEISGTSDVIAIAGTDDDLIYPKAMILEVEIHLLPKEDDSAVIERTELYVLKRISGLCQTTLTFNYESRHEVSLEIILRLAIDDMANMFSYMHFEHLGPITDSIITLKDTHDFFKIYIQTKNSKGTVFPTRISSVVPTITSLISKSSSPNSFTYVYLTVNGKTVTLVYRPGVQPRYEPCFTVALFRLYNHTSDKNSLGRPIAVWELHGWSASTSKSISTLAPIFVFPRSPSPLVMEIELKDTISHQSAKAAYVIWNTRKIILGIGSDFETDIEFLFSDEIDDTHVYNPRVIPLLPTKDVWAYCDLNGVV